MTNHTAEHIAIEPVDRETAGALLRRVGRGLFPEHHEAASEMCARHRIAERERIVAWLRQHGEWPRATAHAHMLADAIARGDHITTGQGDG